MLVNYKAVAGLGVSSFFVAPSARGCKTVNDSFVYKIKKTILFSLRLLVVCVAHDLAFGV